jgi:hypothetical protein
VYYVYEKVKADAVLAVWIELNWAIFFFIMVSILLIQFQYFIQIIALEKLRAWCLKERNGRRTMGVSIFSRTAAWWKNFIVLYLGVYR